MKNKKKIWSVDFAWNGKSVPITVSEADWLIFGNNDIRNYIIYKQKSEMYKELIAIGVNTIACIDLDFIRNLNKYCRNHGYCLALNITFDELMKSYVKNRALFKEIYHWKAKGWIK